MRRFTITAALLVGCAAPDDPFTSTESSNLLQQNCSCAAMEYTDWTPATAPSSYWVPGANNTTIVIYSPPETGYTYAWGVGNGIAVGYIYRMTNANRDQFLGAASLSLAAIAVPNDTRSFSIAGAGGGNPPTPTPGTGQFSAAAVNRVLRSAATSLDALNATKNYGGS